MENLDKRYKFMFQASLLGIVMFLVDFNLLTMATSKLIALFCLLVLFGTLLVHYPNLNLRNVSYSLVMPGILILSAVLALKMFPNLSVPFKLAMIAGYAGLYYFICLMDNIFLVVHNRAEMIPLYRVATAWSMIFAVIVTIPLFAGTFKFSINGIYQNAIVSIIAFVLNMYQIYVYKFDSDVKKVRVGEAIFLSLLTAFFVFSAGLGVAFIPTEAFLRAMFISGILMFGLNFTSAYLKNETSRKMLTQYFTIICIFFLLLLFFIP